MVEPFCNQFFQVCKVDHHSVPVQCFSTAVHGDDAVVPVKPLAFTFIVKTQLVGIGYFDAFRNKIHKGVLQLWLRGDKDSIVEMQS